MIVYFNVTNILFDSLTNPTRVISAQFNYYNSKSVSDGGLMSANQIGMSVFGMASSDPNVTDQVGSSLDIIFPSSANTIEYIFEPTGCSWRGAAPSGWGLSPKLSFYKYYTTSNSVEFGAPQVVPATNNTTGPIRDAVGISVRTMLGMSVSPINGNVIAFWSPDPDSQNRGQ